MTTEQHFSDGPVVPEFHMGDRMAKALEHAGIGRAEMADYMDVSTETLRRWINLLGPVKKSTLRLWALRTGVDLEWLETGQAPTKRSRPDSGALLPRLDSNQQPSGYTSSQVSAAIGAAVVDIFTGVRVA